MLESTTVENNDIIQTCRACLQFIYKQLLLKFLQHRRIRWMLLTGVQTTTENTSTAQSSQSASKKTQHGFYFVVMGKLHWHWLFSTCMCLNLHVTKRKTTSNQSSTRAICLRQVKSHRHGNGHL